MNKYYQHTYSLNARWLANFGLWILHINQHNYMYQAQSTVHELWSHTNEVYWVLDKNMHPGLAQNPRRLLRWEERRFVVFLRNFAHGWTGGRPKTREKGKVIEWGFYYKRGHHNWPQKLIVLTVFSSIVYLILLNKRLINFSWYIWVYVLDIWY